VVPQRAQSTEPLNPLVCGANIKQIYAFMRDIARKKCTRVDAWELTWRQFWRS
jgi:hypothetical protein